jgi:hypothetical protein
LAEVGTSAVGMYAVGMYAVGMYAVGTSVVGTSTLDHLAIVTTFDWFLASSQGKRGHGFVYTVYEFNH